MSSPHAREPLSPPGHLTVTVHDEDRGGVPLSIGAGPGEKVSKVIDDLYARLGYTPEPSDRIVCLANGEDVRQSGDMHMRDYAVSTCADLEWTFARATGGAGA